MHSSGSKCNAWAAHTLQSVMDVFNLQCRSDMVLKFTNNWNLCASSLGTFCSSQAIRSKVSTINTQCNYGPLTGGMMNWKGKWNFWSCNSSTTRTQFTPLQLNCELPTQKMDGRCDSAIAIEKTRFVSYYHTLRGGFYNVKLRDGLRVISLQTNYGNGQN